MSYEIAVQILLYYFSLCLPLPPEIDPTAYDIVSPNGALTEINEHIPLAESCEWCVLACTFPLFDLSHSSLCEGSVAGLVIQPCSQAEFEYFYFHFIY